MFMFFKKRFENTIKAHESETIVLQTTVNEAIKNEESINQLREDNNSIIPNIEKLINSIANTPKEFDDEFEALHSDYDNITELHSTEKYEHKLEVFRKVSNWFITVGASLLAGVGISMVVPNDYTQYSEEAPLEGISISLI
jgi:5-bromo-4-chloroindolyl phosphate hydrolysis protein